MKSICAKASKKVGAFSRVVKYLDGQKAKLPYNALTMSTFNYCPLIWMFCGKRSNKEVKRALRILHNDYSVSFEDLLERNKEMPIHVKNLQFLLIEVYKSLNCQSPMLMWDMFKRRETTYDLRIKDLLQLSNTKTTSYGINSNLFRESILWNSIPDVIKNNQTIASFKKTIKTWTGEKCN